MKRILVLAVLVGVSWSFAGWAQVPRNLNQRRAICQNLCRQSNATDYDACTNTCLEDMAQKYGPARNVKHKKKDDDKDK